MPLRYLEKTWFKKGEYRLCIVWWQAGMPRAWLSPGSWTLAKPRAWFRTLAKPRVLELKCMFFRPCFGCMASRVALSSISQRPGSLLELLWTLEAALTRMRKLKFQLGPPRILAGTCEPSVELSWSIPALSKYEGTGTQTENEHPGI